MVAWFVVSTVILAFNLALDHQRYELAMEQQDENIYYQVEAVRNKDAEPKESCHAEQDENGITEYEYYLTYEYDFVGNDGNTHSLWLRELDEKISLYISVDDPTDYTYPKSVDEIKDDVEGEIKIYLKLLLLGFVLGAGLGIVQYLGFVL